MKDSVAVVSCFLNSLFLTNIHVLGFDHLPGSQMPVNYKNRKVTNIFFFLFY